MEILIVEDQKFAARIIMRKIKNTAQCRTTSAASLSAALELVKSDTALIICDLSLPDADGLEAVIRLRAAAPACKIAAMTSVELPYKKEDIIAAGADRVFTKPFRSAALMQYIDEAGLTPNTP